MVGAFNDKIEFFPATFTGDRDRLVRSLKDLDFGNPTRLYDAIHASIDRLKDVDGRRVVLVFTDGDDTDSSVGAGTVLDEARTDEVMIYAIGFHSDYFNGQRQVKSKPDPGLKKLADETGGGYFELDKSSDLAPTFTRVANELHSQYVLGFTPAVLDGKIHRVLVRAKRPGMIVRARKSYLASADRQINLRALKSQMGNCPRRKTRTRAGRWSRRSLRPSEPHTESHPCCGG